MRPPRVSLGIAMGVVASLAVNFAVLRQIVQGEMMYRYLSVQNLILINLMAFSVYRLKPDPTPTNRILMRLAAAVGVLAFCLQIACSPQLFYRIRHVR